MVEDAGDERRWKYQGFRSTLEAKEISLSTAFSVDFLVLRDQKDRGMC